MLVEKSLKGENKPGKPLLPSYKIWGFKEFAKRYHNQMYFNLVLMTKLFTKSKGGHAELVEASLPLRRSHPTKR
ncbi:hypothetical protein [Hymenobacter psychrophilus]|uniref:hypothetical protein n=1 Tax=Hymenobacter psychrophilus TaxID=651662 RepID=UPI00111490C7|nr:hypothetical protein [Hymenobacter psychrophilus]